jgi:CheY-like chemotaxis protein
MAQSRPLHVLVVEDHPDVAKSTADILRLDGHHVRLAPHGLAALEAARAEEPDVVLLDIGLPEMDGYEVARHLAASCHRKPYLIAVTGYAAEADRRRSAAAGIDLHLAKPADPERLLSILRDRRQVLSTTALA